MLLRPRDTGKRNPIPSMAMIATGLGLLAFSQIWPRATALHGSMSANSVDFIQGVLAGIGIACELMGIVTIFAKRKSKSKNDPV